MGAARLELATPRLSSVCSNQLSYAPGVTDSGRTCGRQRAGTPRGRLPVAENQVARETFDSIVWLRREGRGSIRMLLRKEVIQPQVPLRLPCYDFTPVMNHTVANVPPKVRLSASGATHSHGVTGGVYKARERIHRCLLISDY